MKLATLVLWALLALSSVASAHPGHGEHDMMPPAQGGIVLVGLSLGLASLAWQAWGEKRRALVASADSGASMAGGPDDDNEDPGEAPPEHGSCDHSPCTCSAKPELAPYYTVRIPYTVAGQTQWHPTEATGPFSTLVRGCHRTLDAALTWAREHLGATAYSVVLVTWNPQTEEDTLSEVFSTEGK
jgi:hypothetical protein